MKTKVYIDGHNGTTGLKIVGHFISRKDIKLLTIDDNKRKDINARKDLINQSDYTFLCLPDEAAVEALSLVENDDVKIIDASTAHRTNINWAYGFPELSKEHRKKIATSKRVAVPGCYASGFNSIIYPLIKNNILPNDYPVTCHAISGYSGGGKNMIAQYEEEVKPYELYAPRQYALTQQHKHLKEMQAISELSHKPMFNPIVDDYYNGMLFSVPLIARTIGNDITIEKIHNVLKKHYENEYFVKVMDLNDNSTLENGYLSANAVTNTNFMQIFVFGNDEQILITSRFDNLGKGAAGAAIQCMNIMMGIDEKTSLI